MGNHHFNYANQLFHTISMAMFNGKLLNLLNNQRVWMLKHLPWRCTMMPWLPNCSLERLVTKAAGLIGLRLRGNRYGLGVR
jgi:hypothetical protein